MIYLDGYIPIMKDYIKFYQLTKQDIGFNNYISKKVLFIENDKFYSDAFDKVQSENQVYGDSGNWGEEYYGKGLNNDEINILFTPVANKNYLTILLMREFIEGDGI